MARFYNYQGLAAENLTHVRCYVCGADSTRPVGLDNGFQIVRCNECDLVYVNPRPNPAQLREFYEKYYEPEEVVPEAWEREMGAVFAQHGDWIEEHSKPPGVVLDIGSSFGHFLAGMERRGWKTVGIEPSSIAADDSRTRLKGTVHTGGFEEVTLASESFDAVVSLYVLEHVNDPRGFMQEVFRVLKPGGQAIIRIPFTRPLFPIYRMLKRPLMYAPMHLNDFPPRAMRRMGLGLGFKRVDFRIGTARKASDTLEKVGAVVLGGFGRVVEGATGARVVFPYVGALSYRLYK
ncbi:MAG: class I SAM-dependent methyltransferase [Planctomycetota bacterium]|nr:class I SAM-dependent methyltransferase [Planctomycetota bacterium]